MSQTREKNGSKKTRLGMKKEVKQKALPTGWREVRLGEIYDISAGGDFDAEKSSLTQDEEYPYPIYSNALTNKGLHSYSTYAKYDEDSITITARGDIGFANHRKTKFMAIGRLLVLKNKVPVLNEFVCEYINHRIRFFKETTGVPQLTAPQASKYYITLPPLPEQKAIASLLEKWDTAIEKTEALIAAKEKRFKWLLKTLISDQQDNPEWRKVKLGKVIEDIGDGGTPSRKNSDYFGGGIPWVVIDDITFKIEKTKETLSKLGLSKSTAKIWPKGSVIVSTGATIGHVGIAKIPMATKQGITGIIPKKSITSEYLAYFLLAHTHLLIKYAQGSSFKEIRPETTKKIAFSYPEINLQKDMVSKLNTAQKETDMLRSLAEQYRTQKRGLMQKLLTGKWRLTPSLPRKQE